MVIVTHNMQQAQRVSHRCAFFLAEENQPGRVVEFGSTDGHLHEPGRPEDRRLRQWPIRLRCDVDPSGVDADCSAALCAVLV